MFYIKVINIISSKVNNSIKGISCLSNTSRDHFSVNRFKLWNLLADHWPVLRSFSVSWTVNWISDKVYVLDFWKLSHFTNFVPGSDPVVANEQSVKFDAWVKSLQLFNLIV